MQRGIDTDRIAGLDVVLCDLLTRSQKGGEVGIPGDSFLNQGFQVMDAAKRPTCGQQEAFQIFLRRLLEVKGDDRKRSALSKQDLGSLDV